MGLAAEYSKYAKLLMYGYYCSALKELGSGRQWRRLWGGEVCKSRYL